MNFLERLSDAVWGLPTALLILGAGAYFTVRLGFPQFSFLKNLAKKRGGESGGDGLSPLQSVLTSLSATVGTGSVIGVATAITLGGPGAVFWLWISAFFGMAVAYAEGTLSIKYRRSGRREGGLWYALRDGVGSRPLALVYAGFCTLASFGMGSMAQTNSAAEALFREFKLPHAACGAICAGVILPCLFGRGRFAAKLCEKAMPALTGFYVLGAFAVIIKCRENLPAVFGEIFRSALGLGPVVGGSAGYAVRTAISVGCRRGVFSNEAGLGSTAPLHAASTVDDPDRQGLLNMAEVFVDTLICTLTALALLTSGTGKTGAEAVIESAETVFGGISGKLVGLCVAGFAIATAIGWSQIGLYAAKFLLPGREYLYKAGFAAAAFSGSVLGLKAVWQLSDVFNGLMVLPCMAAVLLLAGDVCAARGGRGS